MGTGNLVIRARTADEALPISNVRIRLKDQQGRLLYDLLTDDSGEAGPVLLFAVDRSLSIDPNYQGTPYTTYDLEASAEGFVQLNIYDVQIFDGETAIQTITLLPLPDGQRVDYSQSINIRKHAVEMSVPRVQVEGSSNARSLGIVVIPNPITVHLGTPTSSASNVQVDFTDYIKNVASSEIYPTWPQASLEANIYAIITFALNRVFTEWYRSRGYNFDITNSTAYDQSFQYGRTIYESIIQIVDRIFNQYVRREAQVEPFFTSFCNGTTATCNGMSQWGTVILANQGMSPLQILRYYYPNDIIISETNAITGIVESFPGTALRIGSTGHSVERIQTFLNRIRRNYPAIPVITDELGVFGNSTEAAVKKFQEIFNLAVDGIVGRSTWNKINSIFVGVTRLAALDSEGTTLGIGMVPPNAALTVGSSGFYVLILQFILSFLGEFYPTIPRIAQDGIFGNTTAQAVIEFQRMRGLSADGIVNAATWSALYENYWSIKNEIPIPGPGPETGVIEYIVQSGDTLWLLAQRFGTTVDAIKTLNGLTSDVIQVGQILLIPGMTVSYTIQPGDTLWLLAQRFGTTVDAIMRLNNLTKEVLQVGQVLQIPGAFIAYSVQLGDTLWLLSQRFGMTVDEIKALNNLTGDVLTTGQILFLNSR